MGKKNEVINKNTTPPAPNMTPPEPAPNTIPNEPAPNTTPKEIVPEQAKVETVTVPVDLLKQMQDQITRLEAAADLHRLAKFDDAKEQEGQIVKTVRVTYIDDKPVLATKLLEDTVFVDSHGVYHEKQIIELYFDDKSTKQMNYTDYSRAIRKEVAEIISQTRDANGETYRVRIKKGGQELSIDSRFIN